MSFIQFQCYACGQVLKVGADKAGRKAKCIKCSTVLTIPVQSTETAISNPPQNPPPMQAPQTMQAPQKTPYPPPQSPYPQHQTPYPPPQQPAAPVHAEYVSDGSQPIQTQPAGGWDDYDDYRGGPPLSPWWKARLGVLLVFIGACVHGGALALYLISYLLWTIGVVQLLTRSGFPSGSAFQILAGVGELLELGAIICAIVGCVFCLLGPNKNNSFGLCIAALAVAGLWLLLTSIFKLPLIFDTSRGYGRSAEFGNWLVLLLTQLLYSAEFILLLLIARAYCLALKARRLAKTTFQLIGLFGGYAGERVLTFIFAMVWAKNFSATARGGIRLILLWIGTFLFMGFIIWYTIFLWRVRERLPEA